MNLHTSYSKYQPNVYRERTPIFWWMHKWSSVRFITRELTSIFIAYSAVLFLLFVRSLDQGSEAFNALMEWLRSPFSLVTHLCVLLFVLVHSITWFNLAPKALVVKLGSKRIPAFVIVAGNYFGWIALSILIALIVLRG